MLSFALLCAGSVLGSALALLYLAGRARRPPRAALAAAHGLLGAAGLAVLGAALLRGLPRHGMGTEGFGRIGAGLLACALLLGLALAGSRWRRRRPPGALVGGHASLAVAALVMLLTLISLG